MSIRDIYSFVFEHLFWLSVIHKSVKTECIGPSGGGVAHTNYHSLAATGGLRGTNCFLPKKHFSFSIQKQRPSVIYFEFSYITHCLSLLCRLGERWLYTSLTQILRSDIGKKLHCILRLSLSVALYSRACEIFRFRSHNLTLSSLHPSVSL